MRTRPLTWPVAKTSSLLLKSNRVQYWRCGGSANWLSGVPLPNPAELTGDPVSIETTWPLISLPSSSVLSSDSLKKKLINGETWLREKTDAMAVANLSFECLALDKATTREGQSSAKCDTTTNHILFKKKPIDGLKFKIITGNFWIDSRGRWGRDWFRIAKRNGFHLERK